MMTRVDMRPSALAAVALVLLVAACGGSAEPAPAPTATPVPAPAVTPTPAATPTPQAQSESVGFRWEGVPAGTDAAPPAEAPALPGGAIGFSHYVFEQVGDSVVTTLVEGPRDLQVRIPASYLQLKEWADAGSAPVDLSMSQEELSRLVQQLDTIRAATEKFRDIDVAVRAGYRQATEEVPNMGAHFVHPLWSLDGRFDPTRPEILLYVRGDDGEWELVGTSFVQSLLLAGFDHPEAFVGPLDNWHVHYELCTGPTFMSRSATQAECRKRRRCLGPGLRLDDPRLGLGGQSPGRVHNVEPEHRACRRAVDRIRDAVTVAGDMTVNIENFGFGNATISAGETLAWSNADGVAHTVTAGTGGRSDGGFDSGLMGPGASFQITFDEPGQLHLHLHPARLHVRRRIGDTVGEESTVTQTIRRIAWSGLRRRR